MATTGGGRVFCCGSAILALLPLLVVLSGNGTLAQEKNEQTDESPRRERRGPPAPDERHARDFPRGRDDDSRGRDSNRGSGEQRGRDDGPGREGGRGFGGPGFGGPGPPRFDGPTETKVHDKGFL